MRRTPAAAMALLLAGCAGLPPSAPPSEQQGRLGRVAIVSTTAPPLVSLQGFPTSRGGGAAQGVAEGFLGCSSVLAHGSCSGSICGAVALLWLGVCGTVGVVSGAAGAVKAPGPAAVDTATERLARTAGLHDAQAALSDQVEAAARRLGVPLADVAQAETLLETTVTRVGTQGRSMREPQALSMEVHARLVRAADGSELFSGTYEHGGPRRPPEEWSARDGERLVKGFAEGYAVLGRHVAEQLFLAYPFPSQKPRGGGVLSFAFGLAPLDPPTRGQLSGDRVLGPTFEWTKVESLRPRLRWDAFPREADRAAAPDPMSRVRAVTYELLVAREENGAPLQVVYRRSGLARPEHALETPLEPVRNYFWTVRARFELDGRERVTPWGVTNGAAAGFFTAPSVYSYRLRTP